MPRTQVLAFAYAALQPSSELLNKYMKEIDRLEAEASISQRDHQVLRSSPLAYDELMNLTLGEDSALTEDTLMQTLQRASDDIRKEESAKLVVEQEAHQTTRQDLESSREQSEDVRRRIHWKCQRTASLQARINYLPFGLADASRLRCGSNLAICRFCDVGSCSRTNRSGGGLPHVCESVVRYFRQGNPPTAT